MKKIRTAKGIMKTIVRQLEESYKRMSECEKWSDEYIEAATEYTTLVMLYHELT